MGESLLDKWAQFVCFKSKDAVSEELFQETWIPRAKAFRARGISLIILSQKANVREDSSDCIFVSKTWWESRHAIRGAFPDGLEASRQGNVKKTPIASAQVGCFKVALTELGDPSLSRDRHEKLVKDEIKVYVMITKSLPSDEVFNKGETLCLIKGFQSYCIYERDKDFPGPPGEFHSWIIEAYFQSFFKDTVLEEILNAGQFKDCKLSVHQDVVQFSCDNI